jgi:phosphotransferase system IIA component
MNTVNMNGERYTMRTLQGINVVSKDTQVLLDRIRLCNEHKEAKRRKEQSLKTKIANGIIRFGLWLRVL